MLPSSFCVTYSVSFLAFCFLSCLAASFGLYFQTLSSYLFPETTPRAASVSGVE